MLSNAKSIIDHCKCYDEDQRAFSSRAKDNPDVFFLTSPEEMEEDEKRIGLKVLKHCGLDFFFAQSAVNRMDEEQFVSCIQLADKLSESPACTGSADHALMICRK